MVTASNSEGEEDTSPLRAQARALFRHSVLDAAEAELAAHGFEATRIQDVARRARVGVGTVYNHFTNKEELLRAVLAERGRQAMGEFAPRPEDGASFEARFLARFERMHAFMEQHIGFFMVASRHGFLASDHCEGGPPQGDVLEAGMRQQVEQLLREGMDEGALEADDPARLARFLKGATKGVLMGAALEGRLELRAEGRWVLERFLRGALRRSPPAGGSSTHEVER